MSVFRIYRCLLILLKSLYIILKSYKSLEKHCVFSINIKLDKTCTVHIFPNISYFVETVLHFITILCFSLLRI